jgi:hypothetical protein
MSRDLSLARITPTQQDAFLAVYRATGLFNKAAQAAGVTKSDIEAYCKGQTGDAENFMLNVQDAIGTWQDTIESEITRRAITGIDRDIFYKGEWIATEKVYSDTLLVKLAEAKLPDFKKQEVKDSGGITIQINTFTDGAAPTATIVEDITDIQPTYVSDLE